MNTSDNHYLNLVLEGDTKAFAALVDRYKDLVFTLANRMVSTREEAEEVAQDTFLKAFRSLSKFKGDAKFSSWIYRICYNTCLDHLKKNKRKPNTVAIDDITEAEVKTLESALEQLEQKEYQESIKKCLRQLPDDEGYIVTLFYFEDLSVDEIATITELSKSNVKVKLFRSRKKLFGILKKELNVSVN